MDANAKIEKLEQKLERKAYQVQVKYIAKIAKIMAKERRRAKKGQ